MQTFSLPLAAAMGCCSFEAYNAPYILHGVKELSPCKTETVYMDRDFMDTLVAGVMEVHSQTFALQSSQPQLQHMCNEPAQLCCLQQAHQAIANCGQMQDLPHLWSVRRCTSGEQSGFLSWRMAKKGMMSRPWWPSAPVQVIFRSRVRGPCLAEVDARSSSDLPTARA